MNTYINKILESKIDWEKSKTEEYFFQTIFDGRKILLRLNDFPDEPICTIIINSQETDIEEFPEKWTLPAHRTNDL